MAAEGRGRIINITSYAGLYRWPLMSAYAAAKAALVKLTETLAEETRTYGVSVFSVDRGLLPIGLCEAALSGTADRQTPAGRVHRWMKDQFDAGRGADPEQAVTLILALASGKADRLSGRHLCVSDNLEALLARVDEIEHDDLHTLRLRTWQQTDVCTHGPREGGKRNAQLTGPLPGWPRTSEERDEAATACQAGSARGRPGGR